MPQRLDFSLTGSVQPFCSRDWLMCIIDVTQDFAGEAMGREQHRDYRAREYYILEEGQPTAQPRAESELPGVGSGRCSLTRDERLACDALAALAHGVGSSIGLVTVEQEPHPDAPTHVSRKGSLTVNEALRGRLTVKGESSWVSPFQDEFLDSTFTDLPAGVAPLTVGQMESLRATGAIGLLTPVQSAQMRVAALNAGELTKPTAEEAAGWLSQPRAANWSILGHTRGFETILWRTGILKAERRARCAGEAFNNMPQWTGLDDVMDADAPAVKPP
ncbi:hypothetical protein C8F04DRAFT_1173184 [Mycena alexandri]|uniref:Uncharacterized protein n=1 Tax=Mycena alexandri TaxID=1745969 RepID=A0AAD6THL3_9AGAR|nr:hypothetical protein C8F04DRAFT_1173184 [Mycena alexandri]